MNISFRLLIIALFSAVLGACVYAPRDINRDRYNDRPGLGEAKAAIRQVFEPADIPEPFKGCTGTHGATGGLTATQRWTTFVVTETNRRSCPRAKLN